MRSCALGSSAVLALALCACGGAPPKVSAAPAPDPPKAVASAAPASAADPSAPAHTLARSAVRALVAQGLGSFLQRVQLDDQPVFVDGKFHGFRIASLRDPKFWSGVDLKPGDVVTGVNGFPIERPEQAQTAFESLEVASELRVAYERDGKGRELVYGIVDDR
jgi:type II secretory pathway component PulC